MRSAAAARGSEQSAIVVPEPAGQQDELLGHSDLSELESEVRSYCRAWPVVFSHATGSTLRSANGNAYLDFFAGAGALNYGHNNPALKSRLLDYLREDGLTHSLDMMTQAKASFLRTFQDVVLRPRGLDYKVQFPGPTGTNAVEAALKLARKVTGRLTIAAFTKSFHGMTLGALAASGSTAKRESAGVPLDQVLRLPYEGFGRHRVCGLDLLEDLLRDGGSGVSRPAAVIVEAVQGEGGVNVASPSWLRRLASICHDWGLLLIVDDVQAGCGRTGEFFSFEQAGIIPDIVCLSKSLSGYGLPMALTIFRRELDVWRPGEHNGTFRGSNPAFITGTAALETYWRDGDLVQATHRKADVVRQGLAETCQEHADLGASYRGRGLIWGIEFTHPSLASRVSRAAFDRGLIVETAGSADEVVKLLPPLTISDDELLDGLDILRAAVADVAATARRADLSAS